MPNPPATPVSVSFDFTIGNVPSEGKAREIAAAIQVLLLERFNTDMWIDPIIEEV